MMDPQGRETGTKMLIIVWWISLLLWLPVAGISGMAFDGGYTAEAYVFFWSVITYPISVILATIFWKRLPPSALTPFLHLLGVWISTLLHRSSSLG